MLQSHWGLAPCPSPSPWQQSISTKGCRFLLWEIIQPLLVGVKLNSVISLLRAAQNCSSMKQREQDLKEGFTESFQPCSSPPFSQILVHTAEIKVLQTQMSFCKWVNWWNWETLPWAGGWGKGFAVSREPDSTVETEPTHIYWHVWWNVPWFLGCFRDFWGPREDSLQDSSNYFTIQILVKRQTLMKNRFIFWRSGFIFF